MDHSLLFPKALAGLLVALALAFVACGGSSTPDAKPGPLVCDTLTSGSYRYTETVALMVTALPSPTSSAPAPSGSTQPHTALNFTSTIQASVAGAAIDATIHNDTGDATGDYEAIQLADNQGFVKLDNVWTQSGSSARPVPIPYQPYLLCTALAPDIDTTKLGAGQAEAVNDVASQKFTLQAMSTDFFAREADFGPSSDVGINVKTLGGTIWVANGGNYPVKIDLTGSGQYSNGQPISVKMTYELSDLGADIKIGAPQ